MYGEMGMQQRILVELDSKLNVDSLYSLHLSLWTLIHGEVGFHIDYFNALFFHISSVDSIELHSLSCRARYPA